MNNSRGSTFMPAVLDSRGNVVGMAGGLAAADHAAAEREAQAAREAEGPPRAHESEVRKLTGMPAYDETDYRSPWVSLRALGFPRPMPPKILTDPVTRKDRSDDLYWDRRAVRSWLSAFDIVAATMQPPQKRHRHLR